MKRFLSLVGLVVMSAFSTFGNSNELPAKCRQKAIVLLGAPGAGKGTQALFMRDKYQLVHLSTGDLFRENIKNNTPLGQQVKSAIEKGEFVPDEIVLAMLEERMQKETNPKGYIFDGFPRTLTQAEALDKLLEGRADLIVLYLSIPDDLLIDRLVHRRSCEECGAPYHLKTKPPLAEGKCDRCGSKLIHRKDDTEEVIRERLNKFHRETAPLKKYYENQGKLRVVDAAAPIEQIQPQIETLLEPFFKCNEPKI